MSGFVVRKILRHLKCVDCRLALIQPSTPSMSDFKLLRIKDNGGLICPSNDVVKLLKSTENAPISIPLKRKQSIDKVKSVVM